MIVRHFRLARRPRREAAGQPRDERARLADQRARVGRQREFIGEKMMDLGGADEARLIGRQRLADDRGQTVLARRIDDAGLIHAGDRRILDDMVRAIQQFLDEIGATAFPD